MPAVLDVRYREGGGQATVQYQLTPEGAQTFNPQEQLFVAQMSGDAVREFCAQIDSIVADAGEAVLHSMQIDHLGKLTQAGVLLCNLLLPQRQQYLAELRRRLGRIDVPLVLKTDETHIYWELLHDGEQFWGCRYGMGRQLLVTTPMIAAEKRPRPRALIVSNPSGDLPEAERESRLLAEWLSRAGLETTFLSGEAANSYRVLQELAFGDYYLVHYSGHVQVHAQTKQSALVLANREALTQETIRDGVGTLAGPVVFLNGCQSADDAANMCAAFMAAGASLVIGTLFRVFEPTARQFAECFYDLVLKGEPVGEAARQARRVTQARADPGWSAFVLYGDPSRTVTPPESEAEGHREGSGSIVLQPESVTSDLVAEPTAPVLAEYREHFSESAFAVLCSAAQMARSVGTVTTLHLLAAQLGAPVSPPRRLVQDQAMDPDLLHRALTQVMGVEEPAGKEPGEMRLSHNVVSILGKAKERAQAASTVVDEELLWCVFSEHKDGSAMQLLERLGVMSGRGASSPPEAASPPGARAAFDLAVELASESQGVTTYHLLLALLAMPGSALAECVGAQSPSALEFLLQKEKELESKAKEKGPRALERSVAVSQRVREALSTAERKARERGGSATASDLAEALLHDPGTAGQLMRRLRISVTRLRRDLAARGLDERTGETPVTGEEQSFSRLRSQFEPPLWGPGESSSAPEDGSAGTAFSPDGELRVAAFGPSALAVLAAAAEAAQESGDPLISTPHLLVALCSSRESTMASLLRSQGVSARQVAELVRRSWARAGISLEQPRPRLSEEQVSPRLYRILETAVGMGAQVGISQATEEHLTRAFLMNPGTSGEFLEKVIGADLELLREALGIPVTVGAPGTMRRTILERFGRNLSRLAGEGALVPVVGREEEIRRIAVTLCRSAKNTPLLVGPAGVGKTAIVEGFAQLLAGESAAPRLAGKEIFEVRMMNLIAGTRYRGDLEERVERLLQEAADPNVILFLDELHTVVGGGSAQGGLDAANMLKPALARGEIRCIGATTDEEYAHTIERDQALARRFTLIRVDEPSTSETLTVLEVRKPHLEKFHGLTIEKEALESAVRLSGRYVGERRQPDKAIDLLEEACASVRLKVGVSGQACVTEEEVREALAAMVPGLTIRDDSRGGVGGLSDLEERLLARVFGQADAVTTVAGVARAGLMGARGRGRPAAVLLFAGPPSVGKTELARSLAHELYGSEDAFLRIDMSEYSEPHTVSRLLGAPPGYVGHERLGRLSEQLRRRPNSVVLLDEFEKAHVAVLDLLLQVFGDGRITDAHGVTVSAADAVFIMTTNLGVPQEGEDRGIGFGVPAGGQDRRAQACKRILQGVREFLRPEMFDRLDEIIVFESLSKDALAKVGTKYLRELAENMKTAQNIDLTVDDALLDELLRKHSQDISGARDLLRVLDTSVAQAVAASVASEGRGSYHVSVGPEGVRVLRVSN